VSHETVRFWWHRFGPIFAAEIRRKRVSAMRSGPQWKWHLDEVFVKINGVQHYLWHAVDHEGEVLESVVTKTQDRKAALKFLRKLMRRYGRPEQIVTDRLRSYGAALGSSARVRVSIRPGTRTIGSRTHTCRSGDESEQCSASGT